MSTRTRAAKRRTRSAEKKKKEKTAPVVETKDVAVAAIDSDHEEKGVAPKQGRTSGATSVSSSRFTAPGSAIVIVNTFTSPSSSSSNQNKKEEKEASFEDQLGDNDKGGLGEDDFDMYSCLDFARFHKVPFDRFQWEYLADPATECDDLRFKGELVLSSDIMIYIFNEAMCFTELWKKDTIKLWDELVESEGGSHYASFESVFARIRQYLTSKVGHGAPFYTFAMQRLADFVTGEDYAHMSSATEQARRRWRNLQRITRDAKESGDAAIQAYTKSHLTEKEAEDRRWAGIRYQNKVNTMVLNMPPRVLVHATFRCVCGQRMVWRKPFFEGEATVPKVWPCQHEAM